MESSTMVAVVQPDSAGTGQAQREHERGQRFAELLQAEPLRENLYIDPPASGGGDGHPVVDVVSGFQELDFATGALERAKTHASRDAPDSGPGGYLSQIAREAVFVQAELLRTAILMETVNSAKQGVTTLFQQQG